MRGSIEPAPRVVPGEGTQVSLDSKRDFVTIEEGVEEIRAGRILVVVDDEDRENEGDLVMAADKVTPEAVNFMARYGRGLICVPILGDRLDDLQVGMMVSDNGSDWFISGAPSSGWDNDDLHSLGGVKGSDFEVVDETALPRPR